MYKKQLFSARAKIPQQILAYKWYSAKQNLSELDLSEEQEIDVLDYSSDFFSAS